MRRKDLADAVKRGVSAKELVQSWGIKVDSTGKCKCPLHSDKTASMKLYPGERGFYCFGCHTGGSVIDLAMSYYGLSLDDAITLLNNDFHLGLPVDRPATKEQEETARCRSVQRDRERRERELVQRIRNDAFLRYCDIYARLTELKEQIEAAAPKIADDKWKPEFSSGIWEREQLIEESKHLAVIIFDPEGYKFSEQYREAKKA